MVSFVTGMEKCRCGKPGRKQAREKSLSPEFLPVSPHDPNVVYAAVLGDIFKERRN